MISVRGLVASSGPFRLRPVDLEVGAGELLVLLGPSGAGKTVLLEALLGMRPIHAGAIVIDGRAVTTTPPEQRHVAYMPQDVALFPHLSVRANIEFGRRVRGQHAGLAADVDRIVESLGIARLLARPGVRSLSGGEAQRVALARALVTRPRVLFLDESFSALDAHIRQRLLHQFRALQQELGLTAIYVTHSLGEAAAVADRIAVLIDAGLVQLSTPERLFREPRDLRVARFLQLDNLYAVGALDGAQATIGGVRLTLAAAPAVAGPAWLAASAGDLMLVHPGDPAVATNLLRGTIAGLDRRHGHSRARIAVDADAGGGGGGGGGDGDVVLECELTARDRLVLGDDLTAGRPVTIHVPPAAVAVFPEVTA